jgi:hypothetical protein
MAIRLESTLSIVYHIDKQMGTTLVVWEGIVTADDFLAHVRRLSSDADWPPPRRLHLSMLQMASLDASMDDAAMGKAADLYGKHRNEIANMKAAIVAGGAFWKAVVFERAIERYGASVIVFNSLDTAATWLGIGTDNVKRELELLRAQSRTG